VQFYSGHQVQHLGDLERNKLLARFTSLYLPLRSILYSEESIFHVLIFHINIPCPSIIVSNTFCIFVLSGLQKYVWPQATEDSIFLCPISQLPFQAMRNSLSTLTNVLSCIKAQEPKPIKPHINNPSPKQNSGPCNTRDCTNDCTNKTETFVRTKAFKAWELTKTLILILIH
jgi:hypothetical protein